MTRIRAKERHTVIIRAAQLRALASRLAIPADSLSLSTSPAREPPSPPPRTSDVAERSTSGPSFVCTGRGVVAGIALARAARAWIPVSSVHQRSSASEPSTEYRIRSGYRSLNSKFHSPDDPSDGSTCSRCISTVGSLGGRSRSAHAGHYGRHQIFEFREPGQ